MRKGATMENQFDFSHWIGHGLSLGAILGTLAGLLPAVAALAAAIWYGVQIYESDTCQKWIEKRRLKCKSAKIAKLRAQQKVLMAELEALTVVREARVIAEAKVAAASTEAAALLAQQKTHEKVHDGGIVLTKSQADDIKTL